MSTITRKIALEKIRFFAFHGFYAEEQVTGTEFFVDAEVSLPVYNNANEDLSQTINYERLFEIVSAQMKVPRKLIETVAHNILDEVHLECMQATHIRIAIRKMHPPLGGEVNNSLVEVSFVRQ
ncbi:dihydroneopterin aldolase [Hufsiella ginkgonis]|uniref:7,8-dihydroneopterin aldolase n=1 Tax=Hufsiella ginkgonis TaxID=2695274 RepID=A0A7K1XSD8_9SPHI|nr:dihydroneopterin aldolase [Hufsiella ginkgonis]MXV13818.1 dihydroneopterin aldolase [Hufsiella ginkgonis]